ncbi:MAG: tRNA pseudouridine(38-40) synthase TruA [Endomicrobia bacterium]|nr:tRNA pseudouridine(38-40) synthase TruA [Endomicrobiia bacterium]
MEIYRVVIEYNGENFYGSQKQSSLRTVESVFENVVAKLLKTKYKIFFASRTDTGVHSLGNVVKLICAESICIDEFLKKVNYFLPKDLQVSEIKHVKQDFNIRKPKYKIYNYLIYNSQYNQPVLFYKNVYWVKEKMSITLLKKAAKIISSQKKFDFATSKNYIDSGKNTECNIKINVYKIQNFIVIKFKGDKFTHRLVRNIVSLLINVACGKISIARLKNIIGLWKYSKVAPAPANALILTKIVF